MMLHLVVFAQFGPWFFVAMEHARRFFSFSGIDAFGLYQT